MALHLERGAVMTAIDTVLERFRKYSLIRYSWRCNSVVTVYLTNNPQVINVQVV